MSYYVSERLTHATKFLAVTCHETGVVIRCFLWIGISMSHHLIQSIADTIFSMKGGLLWGRRFVANVN